ncbi:MAG: hypothetical protein F4Z50_10765 [Gemmatimonadetes bacterium]|nr:hypothetical protein [Gemmatimonadota bacterium]MYD13307.1 hypothetical protein [Gemmatimonadota bacterium]
MAFGGERRGGAELAFGGAERARDGAERTFGAVEPVLAGAGRALAGVLGRDGITRLAGLASGRVRTRGGVARLTCGVTRPRDGAARPAEGFAVRVGAGVTTPGRLLRGRAAAPVSSRFVSGREVRTGEPGVTTGPPDRVRGCADVTGGVPRPVSGLSLTRGRAVRVSGSVREALPRRPPARGEPSVPKPGPRVRSPRGTAFETGRSGPLSLT